MHEKPFATATERNSRAILGVLREEFRGMNSILEIGSGTGQHAVFFGQALEHLNWQTSDVADNHAGIQSWLDEASLPNVHSPLPLDVRDTHMDDNSYDGVFSANTAHIMSPTAVDNMFSLAAGVLHDRGVFVLYGPFRQAGRFNTVSNEQFHQSLQQRDPTMGIRELEVLDDLAARGNLKRKRLYAAPANNHIVVWKKEEGGRS
jgi:cyclopropane fatty-acyl-phospholipid synthase-like methyltransferase